MIIYPICDLLFNYLSFLLSHKLFRDKTTLVSPVAVTAESGTAPNAMEALNKPLMGKSGITTSLQRNPLFLLMPKAHSMLHGMQYPSPETGKHPLCHPGDGI